jgi:membrane protein YdbS with pleckstrin-like domain
MALSRRLMIPGEQVVVELRPHWSFLGRSLPAAVAALGLVVAQSVAWPSAPPAVTDGLLVVLGLASVWLAARLLRWRTTTLAVTTARILERSGLLARRGLDIRLERVNEISYRQSILGRLAGTGQLLIEVGGERGVAVFDHVRRPAALAAVVQEQIGALHGGVTGAGAGYRSSHPVASPSIDDTPPAGLPGLRRRSHDTTDAGQPTTGQPTTGQPSVAQRLVELDELRRRGILSDDEFARKKAELLDRL